MSDQHQAETGAGTEVSATLASDASFRLLEKLTVGVALFRALRVEGVVSDFLCLRKNRAFIDSIGFDGELCRGFF